MAIMKCQECGYEEEVTDTYELCLLVPERCQKEGHTVTFKWTGRVLVDAPDERFAQMK